MSGRRAYPWLLVWTLATVAPSPLGAAVAPMPAAVQDASPSLTVRERAERLAEAASGRFSALIDAQDAPRETGQLAVDLSAGSLVSMVTDWLERAARDYQSRVIEKLSVAASASAVASASEGSAAADGGLGGWLTDTVRSAFGWLQGWVGAGEAGKRETAQPEPPRESGAAARNAELKKDALEQVASNDRSEQDARDFVEARRKAEEELKEAQRLAETRAKTEEEKRRADADEARRKEEADLKAREAARKAETARKHEEYQRRINEGLKKLEEAQKAAEEKRAKEEEAKRAGEKRAEGEKTIPPPVRANVIPDLRLRSAPAKAAGEGSAPAPAAADEKSEAGAKSAAAEPSPVAEQKASELVTGAEKPKAGRSKAAQQQRVKRAKAQRRTREAKGARRKARLVYVVKPGDTLSGIAARYLGSSKRYGLIYRANRHRIKNPHAIQAYQRIVVPLRKA